ncbi:hypothetical protein OESDEN_16252 [Oesophagostomum dentatum]|uniref:YhhN-like protein n=1 Tax=Oesophagostomum dentatum TaxID=61180 RepID=A0A0B1SFE0_OESDE|nr:hypothetical protein OESDEN_16252 [Oesophagostomum dentatum]
MNDGGPARLLGVYGGTCFLVYVETNGFTKRSAMMFGLPLIVLSFMSLTSAMAPKPRICTTAAFAILALSRYLVVSKSSWEMMVIGYALVTVGHMLYFYSFESMIDEWSIPLSMLGTIYYTTLSYHCFADLFTSIPSLVLLHACAFAASCFLVVAAGSVCERSEQDYETEQAAYMRLAGAIANVSSNTIFLLSLFGIRIEGLQILSRWLFYIAEGLMYLANERTF